MPSEGRSFGFVRQPGQVPAFLRPPDLVGTFITSPTEVQNDPFKLLTLMVMLYVPLLYGAVFCQSETPMNRLIAWTELVKQIVLASKAALVQRMHASGESAATIAATLGVSRATIYRVLADADSAD